MNPISRSNFSLPINLVGMTEEEFYQVLEDSYVDFVGIPSDEGSENDSDAEDNVEEDVTNLAVLADGNEEFEISAADDESEGFESRRPSSPL